MTSLMSGRPETSETRGISTKQASIDSLPRDKRIFSTGCAEENAKLTDCYFDKKDWRQCAQEASFIAVLFPLLLMTWLTPELRSAACRWSHSRSAGNGTTTTNGLQPRTLDCNDSPALRIGCTKMYYYSVLHDKRGSFLRA